MREVGFEEIAEAVSALCIKAATKLPPDVAMAIECAWDFEPGDAARAALEDIMENFKCAAKEDIPICQDTGMAVVFAEIGQDVHITGGLFDDAVTEGVRRGYDRGALRKSVVKDPLRRENTEDNTPPVIHTHLVEGDRITITVAPKGFGSENKGAMKMFLPSATRQDVEDFVASVVSDAGADPCPPIIVGVGLGGTQDMAAYLAKKAMIRPLDKRNPDEFYADMEKDTLKKINDLGIGPQGFGGRNTALAVNIETYPTHIAGMPCAVNISCHVTRRASCII